MEQEERAKKTHESQSLNDRAEKVKENVILSQAQHTPL
jgi:hypothetical protein